jgi:hypothetical protein
VLIMRSAPNIRFTLDPSRSLLAPISRRSN